MVDLYRSLGGGWDPADNLEPEEEGEGDDTATPADAADSDA